MSRHTRPQPGFAAHPVERVDKPWGHEVIVAVAEGQYAGKTLHVNAGESLSLQYHRTKHETLAVLTGRIALDVATGGRERDLEPERHLERVGVGPGESYTVPPGLLHRVTALEDAVLMEVSTAEPGWREDVVRLEDRYGRGGTTAP